MTAKETAMQNKLVILDVMIRGGASAQDPEKLAENVNKVFNGLLKGEEGDK